MSEHAKKSRRPLRCTKRDLVRSIEGAKIAGLQISSVRIEPDGTIHVITGASQEFSSKGMALDAADVL